MRWRNPVWHHLLALAVWLSVVLGCHAVLGNMGSWIGVVVGTFAICFGLTWAEPPPEE